MTATNRVYVEPGYYLSIDGHVVRVSTAKAGHSYAQRMVVTADRHGVAVIDWVREFGLGRTLIITPLAPREVSRLVQAAVAA